MNTYIAGTSWLHRLPASVKLVGLLVLLAATLTLSSPLRLALVAAMTVVLYATAGLARAVPAQVRPMRWLLLCLLVLQTLTAGWAVAVVVTGRLVVAVVLAGLVTLTTRVVDLLDVLERVLRPMRRVGVDAERVALMLALAIRTVPVVAGLAGEVRDAQLARGIAASPRAFAVPFVVRSLRHADELGEALVARGLDDLSSGGEQPRGQ
jgi:biotin transport system permease protein